MGILIVKMCEAGCDGCSGGRSSSKFPRGDNFPRSSHAEDDVLKQRVAHESAIPRQRADGSVVLRWNRYDGSWPKAFPSPWLDGITAHSAYFEQLASLERCLFNLAAQINEYEEKEKCALLWDDNMLGHMAPPLSRDRALRLDRLYLHDFEKVKALAEEAHRKAAVLCCELNSKPNAELEWDLQCDRMDGNALDFRFTLLVKAAMAVALPVAEVAVAIVEDGNEDKTMAVPSAPEKMIEPSAPPEM